MDERITASEAVYAFAAWMTCRTRALMIGANYNAAPVADLVKIWCDANHLPDPRDNVYPKNIIQPEFDQRTKDREARGMASPANALKERTV